MTNEQEENINKLLTLLRTSDSSGYDGKKCLLIHVTRVSAKRYCMSCKFSVFIKGMEINIDELVSFSTGLKLDLISGGVTMRAKDVHIETTLFNLIGHPEMVDNFNVILQH